MLINVLYVKLYFPLDSARGAGSTIYGVALNDRHDIAIEPRLQYLILIL